MKYYLTRQTALKWLENPSVYQIAKDELYELDAESFRFFRECAAGDGCTTKDSAFIDCCLEEGLLTTEKVSVHRPAVEKSPEPSLRYLELQITNACNLRCGHCYIEGPPDQRLPAGKVRDIFGQFERMQGLRVLITGGEPLLHPDFDDINEMLPDFAFRKVLFTNGVLIKNELLRKLKVNEIQVSVDGLQPAHDSLRGAGTHERTMNAIHHALDAGFEVSVSTMVHSANLGDFDDMERQFRSLGIREWTVDAPCSAGRMRKNAGLRVGPEEGGKYLAYGYGGGMHSAGEGYACGLHLMAIAPDGRAAKCTFFGDRSVGTIDDGLAACWQRIKPVPLNSLACDCEYISICRGGCRYRAEIFGSARGKDPYRCALYGILSQKE